MDDSEAIKAAFKPLVRSIAYAQTTAKQYSEKYDEAQETANHIKKVRDEYRNQASTELMSVVALLKLTIGDDEITEARILQELGTIDRWDENSEVYSDIFAILNINQEEDNG